MLGFWDGSAKFVRDGLKLYWDAGKSASYPGSGTAVSDLSTNNFDGTLVNGVGYSSANGGELTFDGSNDRIDTSSFTALNNIWGPNMTFEFWVKGDTFTTRQALCGAFDNGSNNGIQFNLNTNSADSFETNDLHVFVRVDGAANRIAAVNNIGIDDGNYHSIVIVFNDLNTAISSSVDEQVNVYFDNVAQTMLSGGGTATMTFTNFTDHTLSFGARNVRGSYDRPFDGNMGLIRAYNRALTTDELTTNFDVTKDRFGI